MKRIEKLKIATKFAGLFFIFFALSSCSKYVKKEDLKEVEKVEVIDLTISPYDWVWNSTYNCWEYNHYHEFINNDVLVGFIMTGQGKQALPFLNGDDGTVFSIIDESFSNKIKITYYDGSSNLSRPQYDKFVYLRIIPSNMVKPNIELTNYNSVKEAYKL